jgi:hypothetical protein
LTDTEVYAYDDAMRIFGRKIDVNECNQDKMPARLYVANNNYTPSNSKMRDMEYLSSQKVYYKAGLYKDSPFPLGPSTG